MHIEEAEDFRLGITEGVEDGTRFERAGLGKIDDHLHAEGPFALVMLLGESEFGVELAADGTHRSVADYRESRVDVDIGEANAADALGLRVHERGIDGR